VQVQDFMPYDTFRDKFINPIKAGQAREATAPERRMMSRRLGVLQDETAVGAAA
jgi:hypothetical protein